MATPTLRVVDALREHHPDTNPVQAMLRGSVIIIETAARDGLPPADAVMVDGHAVQVTLGSEDAFNTWATWATATVDPYRIDAQTVYYSARTTLLGVPVVVQWTDLDDTLVGGL